MANSQRNAELIPNPDPSAITTAQIEKEVSSLESRIMARLDGMVKAVEVFHADLTRVPTSVDKAVLGLREILETRLECMENDVKDVHVFLDSRGKDISEQISHLRDLAFERIGKLDSVTDEKFAGVNSQFSERDTRTDQRAGDTKLAVDAAFAAAKEATAKIEAGFTKQIDSQQGMIETKAKNAEDKIADLKDRIIALESRAVGSEKTTDRTSSVVGQVIAGAVALVVIMTAIVGVVAFMVTRAPAPTYPPPTVNSTAR